MKIASLLLLVCLTFLSTTTSNAWDAVGHRLTTAVALTYLSPAKQQLLTELLQHHPRFQQDFIDALPAAIAAGDESERQNWLLGQAAFWPDIARSLPDAEERRYNRPGWHYIDGAWLRDRASTQGNLYISVPPRASIQGEGGRNIRTESQATNIMTALDYNTALLRDENRSAADRAVALCWVLHLMGDIHQPLHAGALFSTTIFADGDRGGNGIRTDDGNLHQRWDRALSGNGRDENLQNIMQQQNGFSRPRVAGVNSDWSQWLNESRGLLQSLVYSSNLKTAVAIEEEIGNKSLRVQRLDARYVNSMQRIARQRIGLAGLRIAIWVENEL